MGHGIDEIKDMQILLSMPPPDPLKVKQDPLNAAVWIAAIERLESRIILANEIHSKAWQRGPRSILRTRSNSTPEITLKDVQQCVLFIETHILSHVSKPLQQTPHFPINEVMVKLLRFKARLAFDPSFRMLFDYAANALETSRKTLFPNVSILPTSKLSTWYKYYAQYSVLLDIVDFDGDVISGIAFESDWVKEDEGLAISLFTYCLSLEDKTSMKKVLHTASKLIEKQPSFKQIFNAAGVLAQ